MVKNNKRKLTLKIKLELDKGDEIIERDVKKFGGNASHIILPAKYVGKKAFIIVTKKIKNI